MTLVDPRPPQAEELTYACLAARNSDDPDDKTYWGGVAIGYCAAFSDVQILADALTEARSTWWARPYTLDELRPLVGMLPKDGARRKAVQASGVLFGFKMATAERPDAEQCSWCDDRILTEVDEEAQECRSHGWFCSHDCRVNVCPPNRTPEHGCWEE